MAQPNRAVEGNRTVVIDDRFCSDQNVDVVIRRTPMSQSDAKYVASNQQGNDILFTVTRQSSLITLLDERVLLDANGTPVVTLRHQKLSLHSKWEVYRGGTTNPDRLLFSVKKSHAFQVGTALKVYLAANVSQEHSDFWVERSWWHNYCVIYAGESTRNIVAKMHKKRNLQSIFLGKDKYMVTVFRNVDQAFIVALMVILDEIEQ